MTMFFAGFAAAFVASGVFCAFIIGTGVLRVSDDSESGATEGALSHAFATAIDDDLNRGGF